MCAIFGTELTRHSDLLFKHSPMLFAFFISIFVVVPPVFNTLTGLESFNHLYRKAQHISHNMSGCLIFAIY